MKLILTHEVSNVGEPGDVVDVKDGYGRNYLLPRGFAIRWTRGAGKQVESIQKARASRAIHDRDDAVALKQKLEGEPVNVPAQVGSTGRLFGSVTVTDVADALEGAGASVDKRRIEIAQPIKSLGAHTVTVKLHPEVSADVRLNVVSA